MNFEDVKVIWDSQNEQPLFAVNETALHAMVRRRNRASRRGAAWTQYREIVLGLIFSLLMIGTVGVITSADPAGVAGFSWIRVPASSGHVAALSIAAVLWLYYAVYMFAARRRQLRRDESFGSSLQGDIERGLDQLEFQIRIARSIVWWGFVPVWIACALWIVVVFHLKDVKPWAFAMSGSVMAAAFALSVWGQHHAITRRFEPRRRELLALRERLEDIVT